MTWYFIPSCHLAVFLVCQVVTLGELMKRIDAMHGRLALELLDILREAGFIESELPGSYRAAEKLGSPDVQAALAGISSQKVTLKRELVPDLATNVELVWVCMQALPDILTGDLHSCTHIFIILHVPSTHGLSTYSNTGVASLHPSES